MSGCLPPVPDLIPISALLKSSPGGGGGGSRAPCSEVMGEQRPRRRRSQPEQIDSVGSRGSSAAPQPRKARSDRHRKSDRRREHHRKHARTRSDGKDSKCDSSPERPTNPRVNPIFVWIRQEDTRIVDVKCEDYDKRNRILLTKTAQGWRAIPRTETLAPTLKEAADRHHHKHRKSRKAKVRRKSAAVQVDDGDIEPLSPTSPTWNVPVNIESHLPSHKIHVPKKCPSPDAEADDCVNSAVNESAQSQEQKCKMPCDVTPLDNLLAVAEFEFNQHMQSGEWDKNEIDDDDHKDFITNMEQLNSLIESCSKSDDPTKVFDEEHKSDDCDYTEDDDNNLAMDDILSRLEQSLRSPDPSDVNNFDDDVIIKDDVNKDNFDENTSSFKSVPDLDNYLTTSESDEPKPNADDLMAQSEGERIQFDEEKKETTLEEMVESSTPNIGHEKVEDDNEPTDLSIKPKFGPDFVSSDSPDEILEEPTDLSVPKANASSSSPARSVTPRPPSQNSEAIQSPQPSGIPAVPPSPDIVSTSANTSTKTNQKSIFLESLLANSTQKVALNSEVTITRQKEPLDLGKSRKSASPTVTCSSEEVKNNADFEPPPSKKSKPDDITLRTLLEVESSSTKSATIEEKSAEKSNNVQETPRLLELLKSDSSGPDPLVQLRQILYDTNLNVPDPMLVPKEKLSLIISNPGVEIPRLLKQRPELRLPEALAYPHLLQDPDILVITLQQLETIIVKQNQAFNLKELKLNEEKIHQEKAKRLEKPPEKDQPVTAKKNSRNPVMDEVRPKSHNNSENQLKNSNINELANDIDAATAAAFNQMIWLPYLNQLEAMSFAGNPDMMKMLSSAVPTMFPGQMPDLNHLMGRIPPPLGFPLQQPPVNYNNPLEMSMWQEAMMQANMLRPKLPFDGLNPNKNNFCDYLDKLNFANSPGKVTPSSSSSMVNMHKMNMMTKANMPANVFPSASDVNGRTGYHNPFLNIPNAFQQQQQQQQQQQTNNSSKQNLQIPHYNPLFHQKRFGQQKQSMNAYMNSKQNNKASYSNFYHHQQQQHRSMVSEEKNYYHQQNQNSKHHHHHQEPKPKVSCKSFANMSTHHPKSHHHNNHQEHHRVREKVTEFSKSHQPIDLSGSTTPTAKLKVKQHPAIDPVNASKLLRHDDVPEVGSTTASIEEMQDAHKHLWHPLFGNQKGYHSPWNWTSVTATGE